MNKFSSLSLQRRPVKHQVDGCSNICSLVEAFYHLSVGEHEPHPFNNRIGNVSIFQRGVYGVESCTMYYIEHFLNVEKMPQWLALFDKALSLFEIPETAALFRLIYLFNRHAEKSTVVKSQVLHPILMNLSKCGEISRITYLQKAS